MSSTSHLDFVSVVVAFSAVLFGDKLGEVVGYYSVIILCAVLGGAMSGTRRERASIGRTLLDMFISVALALVATIPAAAFISAHWPSFEVRLLVGFVAIGIGFVGSDWPTVFRWAGGLLKVVIELVATRKAGGDK